jgi:TM2 domain-containing membrane protein YozV
MAKKKVKKKAKNKTSTKNKASVSKRTKKRSNRITPGLATLALILNVIFPGIGSLIGGRIRTGILQIILIIAVLTFFPPLIGILVWIGTVIWGIVTGVSIMQDAH